MIEIPITQMFIECFQDWTEDEKTKENHISFGWFYLDNEDLDLEKYYELYVISDVNKFHKPIKSIWKLKSDFHNDLLKIPENKLFFDVLTKQEKNRLKYKKTLQNYSNDLTPDLFDIKIDIFSEETNNSLDLNYTKKKTI